MKFMKIRIQSTVWSQIQGSSKLSVVVLLLGLVALSGCVTRSTTSKTPNDEMVVSKGPDLNEAAEQRLNLGLRYLQSGQIERAKYNLDKAIKYAPDKASVQIGLAYYYEQVKEPVLAEKHYQRAIRIDGKNGDNLNLYGSFLCSEKKYKLADRQFNKAVKQPKYANVAATYENAGVCAKRAGNIAKSEDYFDKALAHNPKSSRSLLEKASFLFENKKLFKARAFLSRHLAVSKPTAQSLWLGIQIERVMGDTDALSSYELNLTGLFPASDEAELYRASKNQ
jgi:type IV pilus assembly protein PilF